jgi:hypothetical protein
MIVEALIYTIISAIITSIVASYKNYSAFLWFILGLFFPFIALVVIIFFKETLAVDKQIETERNSEALDDSSSSASSKRLIAEEFIGEREISNDAYKLHLVKKYNIEKNSVLDSYSLKDKLYKNIDEVLSAAKLLDEELHKNIAIAKLQLPPSWLPNCPVCKASIPKDSTGCASCGFLFKNL